jgi:hypothetical protein
MDAASIMRIIMVVWERLDPPIWLLSALGDDEAAGTLLVTVIDSTEADGVLLVATFLCADGVALDVGADEEVVDEVVVWAAVVEVVELAELLLVDEADWILFISFPQTSPYIEYDSPQGLTPTKGMRRWTERKVQVQPRMTVECLK